VLASVAESWSGAAGTFSAPATNGREEMFEEGVYEARRDRTTDGLAYVLTEAGEPTLRWTVHPYRLGDVCLRGPDDEPVLRVTGGADDEYVDAHFTVVDERSGSVVGYVRWALRSLFRRHWSLLDAHGVEVATAVASSRFRAVVRLRWLRFVPYRYALRDAEGTAVGDLCGSLRPRRAFALVLSDDAEEAIDPRLAVAASAIVDAFEFR